MACSSLTSECGGSYAQRSARDEYSQDPRRQRAHLQSDTADIAGTVGRDQPAVCAGRNSGAGTAAGA